MRVFHVDIEWYRIQALNKLSSAKLSGLIANKKEVQNPQRFLQEHILPTNAWLTYLLLGSNSSEFNLVRIQLGSEPMILILLGPWRCAYMRHVF